jgi:uncharacterized OsmC-like protein
MIDSPGIKAAILRAEDKIRRRPDIGRLTKSTRATVRDGLTCMIEDGPWILTADMKQTLGGREEGPDPGVYGRAALGSCLAIGYATWFARLDVPVEGIAVEVESEFDYGGVLGVSEDGPGYSSVTYTVTVESPAPERDILRVLDIADAHSPWLANLTCAIAPRRMVRIAARAA